MVIDKAVENALTVGLPRGEGIPELAWARFLMLKARWRREPAHVVAGEVQAFAPIAVRSLRRIHRDITLERERAMTKLREKYRAVADKWPETFDAAACHDSGIRAMNHRLHACEQCETAWQSIAPE